jgi:hypothetical protein
MSGIDTLQARPHASRGRRAEMRSRRAEIFRGWPPARTRTARSVHAFADPVDGES